MMKRILLFPVLFVSIAALSQSADDLLNEYYKAINQEKLCQVTSFIMTGNLTQMGVDIPMEVLQERPGKIRTSGTYMGLQFVQTYNGQEGWSLNPFMGQTEPVAITGNELTSLHRQADLDGMLYDYAAKGSHVSMAQPEMIDMVSHPKIELTTEDTVVYEVIFDPETFYCKLIRSRSDVQGRMSVVESVFSDFRTIDGIVFATSVETRIDGMTALRIHFDEIKLNEDIDDSLFDKP
ncbi:MAG: hypothetical protein H6546_06520 [Chitinophagales bacterium]|nr:hypothetical protein [Chitinophagales bacterium]MCB9032089.1 hypothetical protein [Chitinophagales bacterium]HRX23860.1 hypothetical protein [Chitinophagales bacterium]